jgi:hypothetical protein
MIVTDVYDDHDERKGEENNAQNNFGRTAAEQLP